MRPADLSSWLLGKKRARGGNASPMANDDGAFVIRAHYKGHTDAFTPPSSRFHPSRSSTASRSNKMGLAGLTIFVLVNCALLVTRFNGDSPSMPTGGETEPLNRRMLLSGSAWDCTATGIKERERVRAKKQQLVATNALRQLTAKEVGPAKVCRNDFETPLPVLFKAYTAGNAAPKMEVIPATNTTNATTALQQFTLAMQVPVGRLALLSDQCRIWKGLPLVATVYVPMQGSNVAYRPNITATFKTLDDVIAAVYDLQSAMSAAKNTCNLQMDVYVEQVCDPNIPAPLNALRNRAMRMVQTKAVVLADGEHLLSSQLARVLKVPERQQQILAAAQQMPGILIPALEVTNSWLMGSLGRQLAVEIAADRSRVGVVKLLTAGSYLGLPGAESNKLVGPMNWGLPTEELRNQALMNWTQLYSRVGSTSLGNDASPHFISLTEKTPWYDERIRGRYMSQEVHSRHMERLSKRANWGVLGDGWAVRIAASPPAPAPEDPVVLRQRQTASQYTAIGKKEVSAENFVPITGMDEICYTST